MSHMGVVVRCPQVFCPVLCAFSSFEVTYLSINYIQLKFKIFLFRKSTLIHTIGTVEQIFLKELNRKNTFYKDPSVF